MTGRQMPLLYDIEKGLRMSPAVEAAPGGPDTDTAVQVSNDRTRRKSGG